MRSSTIIVHSPFIHTELVVPACDALTPRRQSGLADLGDGRARCDRLGIDHEIDQRRLAGAKTALEGGRELPGFRYRFAMQAIGAGEGGEIRVLEVGCDHALRIFALLM